MTDPQNNPFILPGLGQSGDAAGNPLLASMEMMRKAWSGLMGPGGLAQVMPMTPPLNLEDLDRRIAELRTVESWLRLNLSMLGSTIQGLEVQRSTINTLRSFVDSVGSQVASGGQWGDASPLEVALGLKPMGQRARPGADAASGTAPAGGRPYGQAFSAADPPGANDEPEDEDIEMPEDHARNAAAGPGTMADEKLSAAADKLAESGAAAESGVGATPAFLGNAAQSASEAWWNLLQQQFGQLAAATAASMPAAMAGMAPPAPDAGAAPAGDGAGAGKSASRKAGAANAAPAKAAGNKAAGTKTAATKAPARKTAAKPGGDAKAAAVTGTRAHASAQPARPAGAKGSSKPSPAARAPAKKPLSKTAANGAPRNAAHAAGARRRPLS